MLHQTKKLNVTIT